MRMTVNTTSPFQMRNALLSIMSYLTYVYNWGKDAAANASNLIFIYIAHFEIKVHWAIFRNSF